MILLVRAAKIVEPGNPFHQQTKDILIEDGRIKAIGDALKKPRACTEISFENLHISQGWFDTSVCFGEPGYEERETIENGLKTAARSGFTAVAVHPNTAPFIDHKAAVEFLINKANNTATKLYPIGNLSRGAQGKDMAELFDMQQSGAIAFGDYNQATEHANLLKICLQYAQNFDGLLLSFPQDNSIAGNGLVNEGVNSTKLGLRGIPALAEEMQVARDLFLLEYTGGKLHIPTISTKGSVALIKAAKEKGLDVSCSVSAHHLVLTDDELVGFDTRTKVLPPLRTQEDNAALIKGLKDGSIDMITSDHNPIDIEHKKMEYGRADFGTIGLESLFGALAGIIALDTLIPALTTRPKARFGLESHSIREGEKATLTLFNPEASYVFTKQNILSSSSNSVFLNKKMKGVVYGIIARGKADL